MQEYTVIKKGQSIQPCINIPDEFKNMELEIKKLELLTKREDIKDEIKASILKRIETLKAKTEVKK